MAKHGRNNPCHCGSGLKYKRCCLDADQAPPLSVERDDSGLLVGKPPIETLWEAQGKRVRAIGSTVSFRPPNETNHEFLIDLLRHELGPDWNRGQLDLPENDRHPLHQWNTTWDEARAGLIPEVERKAEGDGRYSAAPTGDLSSLLCVAYDAYTLKHSQVLPEGLVGRLKHRDQFQGARYELAVSAVFVRAGYEISWLTETDRKLPEFIATHPDSGKEIAVEAKSRHRPGILGREGEALDGSELRSDVSGLLRKALQKETDERPFVICIDLNLPADLNPSFSEWISDLSENALSDFQSASAKNPDPWSAVFFTN